MSSIQFFTLSVIRPCQRRPPGSRRLDGCLIRSGYPALVFFKQYGLAWLCEIRKARDVLGTPSGNNALNTIRGRSIANCKLLIPLCHGVRRERAADRRDDSHPGAVSLLSGNRQGCTQRCGD